MCKEIPAGMAQSHDVTKCYDVWCSFFLLSLSQLTWCNHMLVFLLLEQVRTLTARRCSPCGQKQFAHQSPISFAMQLYKQWGPDWCLTCIIVATGITPRLFYTTSCEALRFAFCHFLIAFCFLWKRTARRHLKVFGRDDTNSRLNQQYVYN